MQSKAYIEIEISSQRLRLKENAHTIAEYQISTARNGPGEQCDSECTPRGLHRIRIKIGADCPCNTVFVGRRATGEIYTPDLRRSNPGRDWILTRILWLTGLEPGINRGGNVDTLHRYIYIHGCPDDEDLGAPGSRGCIRMHNQDLLRLFDQVAAGTLVEIREYFRDAV